MVDRRHQDELHDIQQDIRREECTDRDVEAVSEFQHFCARVAAGWAEEALLSATAGHAGDSGAEDLADDEVCQGGNEEGAGEEVDEDEHQG